MLLLGQRRQPSLSCAADLQQFAREPVATVNEDQKDGAGRRVGDSSLDTCECELELQVEDAPGGAAKCRVVALEYVGGWLYAATAKGQVVVWAWPPPATE